PATPVYSGVLTKLIRGAKLVRGDTSPSVLAQAIADAGRVVILDALSEADLARIAAAVKLLGPRVIPVGSAGLARHIAGSKRQKSPDLDAGSDARGATLSSSDGGKKNIVVCVTSLNHISLAQCRQLEQDYKDHIQTIFVPSSAKFLRRFARTQVSITI